MFIDMERMVYEHLQQQIEDLYAEHLGDECPLVVHWFGLDVNLALVTFEDYEYPGIELLLGEDIVTKELTAQFQGHCEHFDKAKFIRKHERTIEIIREQWFPNRTVLIKDFSSSNHIVYID